MIANNIDKSDEYSAKQDRLSDLYYIKTKKPVIGDNSTPNPGPNSISKQTDGNSVEQQILERHTQSLPKTNRLQKSTSETKILNRYMYKDNLDNINKLNAEYENFNSTNPKRVYSKQIYKITDKDRDQKTQNDTVNLCECRDVSVSRLKDKYQQNYLNTQSSTLERSSRVEGGRKENIQQKLLDGRSRPEIKENDHLITQKNLKEPHDNNTFKKNNNIASIEYKNCAGHLMTSKPITNLPELEALTCQDNSNTIETHFVTNFKLNQHNKSEKSVTNSKLSNEFDFNSANNNGLPELEESDTLNKWSWGAKREECSTIERQNVKEATFKSYIGSQNKLSRDNSTSYGNDLQHIKSNLKTDLSPQQNHNTRKIFGIVLNGVYQPKTPLYRNQSELSGSYASLECPSPPGPPVCLSESQKDPRSLLINYLKKWYQDLCFKEPVQPPWSIPVPPGTLCPARLELDLRLSSSSHGFSDILTIDQILVPIQTRDGNFLEAPKRCVIECPTWISSSNLCLRIIYSWIKEPPWPTKGTPVALIIYVPLRELKRSFSNYIEKEILPKGSENPFNNVSGRFIDGWNALNTLGPKLLIILDGFCSQKLCNNGLKTKSRVCSDAASIHKNHYPTDVRDLLDGKLFPEARLIITTSSYNCSELMPVVQRHLIYEGLTWGKSASILSGGEWKGSTELLQNVQENSHLKDTVRTPLGCLAIATIYESLGDDLPMEDIDIVESIVNCVAPNASPLIISELGRYSLFCLKMQKSYMKLADIKMYCSLPDTILGCLERSTIFGKTAKKKSEYMFNAICPNMIEFFAAHYIASLADRPCLLAAEIAGMAVGDELDPKLLKVLKFAMALLGEQAYILLSRLTPLWLSPQTIFTLSLAGGQNLANLAALCDIMGISKHSPISPLETKPLWVQVRSMPTDLMGWGMALKSPTCTLKNLEVVYQLEKQTLNESKNAVDIFIESMALNESVSTLRFSSLIEMDVKDSEINYMANCISRLLLKPRLENFELVLTLIEEDPPMLKLQSVVVAMCKTIHLQTKLSCLLLDLGLCSSQLVQLCNALEKCPNITRLSLPHLRCDKGAISALSSLLNKKPLSFLALPSCWGARDDPPSSSGVSMGSGSGSSTGTSCLIKQGSLPGVPSPRSYAPGIFSSLPRGALTAQASLGRSATLPRQPLEQCIEKRSCDSVVSKTWYPTPACDGGPHNSGTLHDLFAAIRDPHSRLYGLDLSKAQLSLEDSMCLGETVRVSKTLHTLKLEGSSRISEVLPTILGSSDSPCLQMLSLGSQRLSIDDTITVMCTRALSNCGTLRLLSIEGWCFRIEHVLTFSMLRTFLCTSSIRELSLTNCRLQTGAIKEGTTITNEFVSKSVVVLKLGGAQIILPNMNILRGPQLLQYLGCFPFLRELDLSAPPRSGVESTHSSPMILDSKTIIQFFQKLHTNFRLLNTLKICNWIIHLDEFAKTNKQISKIIRNSPISFLKLDGISVLDRAKKKRNEAAFIRCFISSMPQLRWLGISLSGKKEEQISEIGNSVSELRGSEIEMKLSESTIDQAKLMAQVMSLDGKFDINVSTFGTSSVILIHAVKSGVKSLTRRQKDTE